MLPTSPFWQPRSTPQRLALSCPAEVLLFGGAAGSLKSETLLMDAAAEKDNPRLSAILFRRTYPELEKSLIRRSRELYAGMGARYNEQKKIWTFPSGATVEFAYCEKEDDIYRYQGAEYSFIGFDESTHFREEPIRYLTSRLRSTEPSLVLRLRLATNPGNVGHIWHRNVFIGPACHHCLARERRTLPGMRVPGRIYSDAVWPSDGRPLGKRTAFVPGSLADHTLLPPSYAETLAGMTAAYREALLAGCWAAHEGQFFDCWDPARMVVGRTEIGEESWWPYWAGVDYGFAGSQAAAYLLTHSPATTEHPKGIIYVLDEYTAKHQKAADFAVELRQRFGPQREREANGGRRIANWYLSPDAWANRGDDHSLADQMVAASDIGFDTAANDRRGGAMLCYSMLDGGEVKIADCCTSLIESIPTRIHDKNHPGDIVKVKDDPLDDCIDAFRYGLYSHARPAKKTAEHTARDKLIAISDPTARAMAARRMEWEARRPAATYMRARHGRG